jgi:hypothetical protein
MKSFKAQKAYLACMLVLTVFIGSSLVYGASDEQAGDHTTPDTLGAVALFAGSGGAGMTSQGMYPAVNGNIDTAAASASGTGFHDKGTGYAETNSPVGIVNGTIRRAHPACQDSCSL